MRAGDVVAAINRQAVRSLSELRRQFPIANDRELALEIRRRGVAYLAILE